MRGEPAVDRHMPEVAFAELVDAAEGADGARRLAELLDERHDVHAGRRANATTLMRGYVLAAFERVGLPDSALIYAIEELESGRDAYLVAAAARALRGLDGRERRLVPFLLRAVDNVRDVDDMVTFDTYQPRHPVRHATTALAEIFGTLAWRGPAGAAALPRLRGIEAAGWGVPPITREALARAIESIETPGAAFENEAVDCCAPAATGSFARAAEAAHPARAGEDAVRSTLSPPTEARFEDQHGREIAWPDAFAGRPSVVAFFYTRCTNPNKCSLTISKLARLQRARDDAGLGGRLATAAITYDPAFDLPPRLRAYGELRGVTFGDNDRFLRATRGFRAVSEYFDLGVSYGEATVNRHRIEAFLLDGDGRIAARFTRLQWEIEDVLDKARTLVSHERAVAPAAIAVAP